MSDAQRRVQESDLRCYIRELEALDPLPGRVALIARLRASLAAICGDHANTTERVR